MSWSRLGSAALTLGLVLSAETALAQGKLTRVGVVVDGKAEFYEELATAFKEEAKSLIGQEFDVQVDESKVIVCKFDKKCVEEGLSKLLADPEVDVVIGQGFLASALLVDRDKFSKPSLAPFVVDPRSQGLNPEKKPKNLGYLLWSPVISADLRVLSEIAPYSTVGLVVGKRGWAQLPDELTQHMKQQARANNKKLVVVEVPDSAEGALAALPEGVDAVYVGPLLTMPKAEREKFAAGLVQKKLPSFTWAGESGVKEGFLAGTRSGADTKRLARRFALDLQSLLLNEPSSSSKVGAGQASRLFLNGDAIAALALSPQLSTLMDTVVIGNAGLPRSRQGKAGSQLSLKKAVELALKSNVDISQADYGVEEKEQERRGARSPLLPQIGLGLNARIIDGDRAFATNTQRQASWSATARQTLYDENAWGGFDISKHQLKAQEENRNGVRLNVIYDVTSSYIELLSSQTSRRIQLEDLSLSRDNLDMARVRQRVGQAGMEEVYRWESRIAQSRRGVLDAEALMASSRVRLNTLLNRPAETAITPEELTVQSAGLLSSLPEFRGYLSSPRHFKALMDFTVQEGLKRAPELRQVGAQIDSVKRQASLTKRSYFLPTVALEGSFNHRFAEGGEPSQQIPGFEQDKIDWMVGVSAELPLFEGARRHADIQKSNAQEGQLSFQKKAIALDIEQSVRANLYQTGASYATIAITQGAERAALGNLRIVKDKYQRGRATIIELLDAQNEAIVAQNQAATAVYAFLLDLMKVERAAGRFDFTATEEDQKEFMRSLAAFSTQRGLSAPRIEEPSKEASGGAASADATAP